MMAKVRSTNTKPEMLVRRGLHALGFRFRLHAKSLPGHPDVVLARYHAVIFIHGCFWHGHGCRRTVFPESNEAFWRKKLQRNMELDRLHRHALSKMGWRQLVVWECALRGKGRVKVATAVSQIALWLRGSNLYSELLGVSGETLTASNPSV